jgi:hypothetical protein
MDNTDQADPHVSVSFSLPVSVKSDMDKRAKSLRISRSDYLKLMVLWDLDHGPDAPFEAGIRKPTVERKKERR